MTAVLLNAEHEDALKEICNIAMGQAGAGLAALLAGAFVDLSVPEVRIVSSSEVASVVTAGSTFGCNEPITSVRQMFHLSNQIDGEALVFFDPKTCSQVAGMMGHDADLDRRQETEVLFEIANLISGACLNGVSRQLFGKDMSFVAPSLLARDLSLSTILDVAFTQKIVFRWDYTLFIKIRFKLKEESFRSELLILMSERSIEVVKQSIDCLVERMLA